MTNEKMAPVQGYAAGIPWAMHLRAYDAYCKRWAPQKALIEGGCRGGFSVNELDMLIPGWREELSELHKLKARVKELEEAIKPFDDFLTEMAEGFTEGWVDRTIGTRIVAAQNNAVLTLDHFRHARDVLHKAKEKAKT